MEPLSNTRKEATVPMWVVAYAVRYGIRRQSYARSDALALARQYWDDLDDATRCDVTQETADGN